MKSFGRRRNGLLALLALWTAVVAPSAGRTSVPRFTATDTGEWHTPTCGVFIACSRITSVDGDAGTFRVRSALRPSGVVAAGVDPFSVQNSHVLLVARHHLDHDVSELTISVTVHVDSASAYAEDVAPLGESTASARSWVSAGVDRAACLCDKEQAETTWWVVDTYFVPPHRLTDVERTIVFTVGPVEESELDYIPGGRDVLVRISAVSIAQGYAMKKAASNIQGSVISVTVEET